MPESNDPAAVDMPLDFAQLTRRCMGKIEFAERLLASFEERFPQGLSQIEQYLADGNTDDLARLTHQLKGAAANVSAPALQAIMTDLDDSARSGQLDVVVGRLPDVHRAWDRFKEVKSSLPSRVPSPAAITKN
jgi:HPt (histidine-containing phosphotransfer) domain-containing protein